MADTGIFAWLDRASRFGDVDVERSAEMLKNYYQGVGPEPEYGEQATTAKNAAVRFDSELRTAAEAVVARWDSPKWKDEPHTAIFINRLRAALASRPAEVDDEGLPPLPPPVGIVEYAGPGKHQALLGNAYTSEQLRQGQRDAVAADRARHGSIDGQLHNGTAQSNELPCLLCKINHGRGCWAHKRPTQTTNEGGA